MRRWSFRVWLVCGLLWGAFLPAETVAGDWPGWLAADRRSHTAEYLGGTGSGPNVPLGPQLAPPSTLFRPRDGNVPVVPGFNWGYFGAPYHPVHFCHKDYYGECSWWFYRRR